MQEPGDRERGVLREVAQALNAPLDLPSLLARALEKVAELLGLETGWVLLLDAASGEPYAAATQNLPPGLSEEPERMTGWCFCLRRFVKGEHPEAANVGLVQCSRLRRLSVDQGNTAGLRFHASIPLEVRDQEASSRVRRVGMLNVASTEWRAITDDELDVLRTIGGLLGVAIERAQLHEQRLEAAQTEERLRLAREIHDTVAQDLSAIAMHLDTAALVAERGGTADDIREHVASARTLADKGLRDVRRSVLDLRAAPLEGRSLPEALEQLAESRAEEGAGRVEFEVGTYPEALPPAIEIGIYRIAQEALQNASRHAAAERIRLYLSTTEGRLILTVDDDGTGFDTSILNESRASGRFGVVGMQERARLLGGSLRIESTPGVGTRVSAEVPVQIHR